MFSSLCTLNSYYLEDSAICASVLLGLWNEGYFLGDFWKISLGPPFALFEKMRILGDLARIAITWPFVHFWFRLLRQNLLQCLHFKCILNRGECYLRKSAFGPFRRGLLFGRFLKNLSWSPLCTFSRNAGFGWPCKTCHNLAVGALLEPPFSPKSSPVFALKVHTN